MVPLQEASDGHWSPSSLPHIAVQMLSEPSTTHFVQPSGPRFHCFTLDKTPHHFAISFPLKRSAIPYRDVDIPNCHVTTHVVFATQLVYPCLAFITSNSLESNLAGEYPLLF